MKMKLFAASLFISTILLISCAGNDNKDYTDKSVIPTAAEKKAAEEEALKHDKTQPVNIQQANTAINPAVNTVNPNVQPQMVQVKQPAVQKTAPGMNPPHGQPNHRCDIAVGAPLNSPPGPTATKPSPVTINAQPPVQTAPGMNPPHGQPNHRCDIAIGAPLNSPVGPTTVPVKMTTTPVILAPPKADSTKN